MDTSKKNIIRVQDCNDFRVVSSRIAESVFTVSSVCLKYLLRTINMDPRATSHNMAGFKSSFNFDEEERDRKII